MVDDAEGRGSCDSLEVEEFGLDLQIVHDYFKIISQNIIRGFIIFTVRTFFIIDTLIRFIFFSRNLQKRIKRCRKCQTVICKNDF